MSTKKKPSTKRAPKLATKKDRTKSRKLTALAKAREIHVVASRDLADDEYIVRHMSTEDLAASAAERALAIVRASVQSSPAEQLAYGALLELLDVDKIVVVREDDGSLWAFVPNDPSPERWRGAIRRRGDLVEESWFLPDESKIVWEPVT